LLFLLPLAGALAGAHCGSSGAPGSRTDAGAQTGGVNDSGGTRAAGGSLGSGGQTVGTNAGGRAAGGSGGAKGGSGPATGGSPATGGGSGGAAASGGTTSAGGATANNGSLGAGGGATGSGGRTVDGGVTASGWVTIHNDFFWYDTDGNLINVRSGALRKFGDTYYWYGGAPNDHNQNCYSSTDLVHWAYKGYVLTTIGDANRMDILYNATTQQYVIFLEYIGDGAYFGIATGSTPDGQFTFKS
jgi:hypothetical protein